MRACRSWNCGDRPALDDAEMRDGVEVIATRVIDDAVKRSVRLDADHLVDLAEREVVTTARLVRAGIHQPWAQADALHESNRLPRRCHLRSEGRGRCVRRYVQHDIMQKTGQGSERASASVPPENDGTNSTRATIRRSRASESAMSHVRGAKKLRRRAHPDGRRR